MKCVLEWLEETACAYSGKTAFKDDQKQRTFTETYENAKAIGSFLIGMKHVRKPVVVLIDKCCDCIDSMLGALYANCYYVVIDVHSPIERINLIVDTLENPLLIYNKDTAELANQITIKGGILPYEKLVNTVVDDLSIDRIRQDMIDMDIAYILFTSGSTGVPKGTVITHKSLIAYIDWVSKEFCFNENTIFGSQTPLYFSMSVTDLYSTIKCGCTFHIIPKALFVFPLNLIEFLNEMKINTIYWVPTALSILANWKAFDYAKPDYLKTIMFAGEVMPMKQLNYWIRNLPGVIFANLFGPTETTDICTFYKVNRVFSDNDSLPIGKHCDNCKIYVIKDDGTEAQQGEEGELFVRSSFVACGYYNNQEKTSKAFVQNPLNKAFPEIVYRTGDIVKYNDYGELMYVSRKDFQIKRSGYRIELGEIETATNSVEQVKGCVCVYDKELDCLAVIYEGRQDLIDEIRHRLGETLPAYMMPNDIIRIDSLPLNANGKIDRVKLAQNLKTLIKRS